MRAKVLKTFPYAHDGFTVVTLKPGDEADIQDDAADGLIDEGFIEELGDDAAAPTGRRRRATPAAAA